VHNIAIVLLPRRTALPLSRVHSIIKQENSPDQVAVKSHPSRLFRCSLMLHILAFTHRYRLYIVQYWIQYCTSACF
jgi:hypothetical protein